MGIGSKSKIKIIITSKRWSKIKEKILKKTLISSFSHLNLNVCFLSLPDNLHWFLYLLDIYLKFIKVWIYKSIFLYFHFQILIEGNLNFNIDFTWAEIILVYDLMTHINQ